MKLKSKDLKSPRIIALAMLGTILIIISSLKALGIDQDYFVYSKFLGYGNLSSFEYRFEPATYLIRFLTSSNITFFFFIYALLGISLKLVAIYKMSNNILVAVLGYLLSYYLLHDYTQVRAGVASALFLLAIHDLDKEKTLSYFTKSIIAITFHFSAIIMVLIFPILKIKNKNFFVWLPVLGIILLSLDSITSQTFTTLVNSNEYVHDLFKSKQGHEENISVFSFLQISYLLFFMLFSVIRNKLKPVDLICYKILSISLFIYYATLPLKIPVVTYRITEYLFVVIIVLIPNITRYFKHREIMLPLLLMYFMLYGYHLIFNIGIIL